MKTRITLLFIIAVFTFNIAKAQTNINNYKYVIVPTTFDFFTKADQYRLNTLTKLLLEKHGLIAMMEDEILPDEAISNNCLVLKADVLSETGAFYSKLKVQLKNCKNQVIFLSKIGKSREKNNQVSYTLALREAFRSLDAFKYEYKEDPSILAYEKGSSQESNDEIEKLKREIKTLKEEKEAVVEKTKDQEVIKAKIKETKVKEDIVNNNIVEVPKEKKELQSQNNEFKQELTKKTHTIEPLFAKPIPNGYSLIDSAQKEVMVLYKTGKSDFYIVKGKDAIVYRRIKNIWLYLEANDENHSERPIVIEF